MEAYKFWVRKNRDFVHSLESLANGITWLLPERFSNSEIVPETVYAVLGVFSAVNQHIIDTTPSLLFPKGLSEPSFPWSLLISVIKDMETVIEVATQYYLGEKGKWNFLAATEGVKALVRLAALRDSRYKMLLHGGELVNDKGAQASRAHNGGSHAVGMPGYMMNEHALVFNGSVPKTLEGRAVSALNRFAENAKMVSAPMRLNRIQQNIDPPAVLVEKPTLSSILFEKGSPARLFLIGEVLSIIRPLIYVLLIRKFGIKSWIPWTVSLAVDVASMSILSHATRLSHEGGEELYQLSKAEEHELKRRKLIWALYIMRDPFFTKYTRHHLEKADRFLSPVPLIGFFTAKLVELLTGLQTRYTYTSAS